MSVAIQTGVPVKIEAGNTVKFTETLTDYPGSAWTMQFVLSQSGSTPLVVDAVSSGDIFTITLTGDQTKNLKTGQWDWAQYVTSQDERTTAKTGVLNVLPNLAAPIQPSVAAQMLNAINAAILKLSSGTDSKVNFNGQQFEKKDLKSLLESRVQIQAEVAREQQKEDALRGRGTSGRIPIAFTSPYDTYPPYGYSGVTDR